MAALRLWPHICSEGRRLLHTGGRSGRPKILHLSSESSCTQGTPAGFPSGIPGMGDEIEGAVQQAAQRGRHSIGGVLLSGCCLCGG